MRSVMKHDFSKVPKVQMQRSAFNRSHGHKTTLDAGYLVPIYIDEALPGDTFNLNTTLFGRLATALTPIMDNLFLETFFFAVPYRLIWTNWEKFNGAQDNPGDSISFTLPVMDVTDAPLSTTGYTEGSLSDHMGLPTEVVAFTHTSVWHRAYNLIYNEWFRDENLQNKLTVDTGNGPDDPANYVMRRRGKRFDYFTSALTSPQKGSEATLPLGTSAPVILSSTLNAGIIRNSTGTIPAATDLASTVTTGYLTDDATHTALLKYDPNSTLIADLSTATAASINLFRQANAVQVFLERDARGGTRYVELLRSHWNVVSPDFRLQRPEFLGGSSQRIGISAVPQTSESATTPQATLAAMGVVSASNHGFVKSFVEHCLLIGIVNVRADLNYQGGLDRKWSRSTRYDFYHPVFANLGEQAILNKELLARGSANPTQDAATWGYQERWAEYRYARSEVTGQFRSNFATSLDIWHLSQDFGTTLPTLATTFIQDDPPVDRVIATPDDPHLILDCYFDLKCARPMPMYSVPGLAGRF